MAADCEQIRGRMLELLYGELPPDARAEVAAHVAGCDACRAELAALESTRALARRALSADSPPPRARQAILRAAAEAATARRTAAPAKPSLWAWLRRTRWTLPTFATVGAVAVFLLASRIFLEPEKTYLRGRQGLVTSAASPPASPPVPTSAPATAPREEKNAERERVEQEAQPAAKPASHGKHAARAAAPAPAAASAPEPAFAPPPPAKGEAMMDYLEGRGEPPADRASSANADKKSRREDNGPAAAPPPPPPPAPAAAPAPAAPRAVAPAPARAAAKSEAPAAEGLVAPAGSGAGAERESPAARADRLFAQQRWAEAAVAYNQLLRDDPRNAGAARWRQRLAACKAALDQDR
jgi:hypothetical protein